MTNIDAIKQLESIIEYFEDRIEKEKDPAFDKDTAKKDVEAMRAAIEALEQTKWIPVSEKPQKGRYLCTFEHYDGKCIDFGSFDGEVWYIKPIAYMPLPQPYKAESEEV